jgi:N-acyl-D-amino-acid deacylase
VASYIGAATIREHVVGLEDRPATPAELEKMRALVRQEMEAGALGIGSSLIYAPGTYASTEELIELNKAAAPTAAATSRTCAARATGSWRRWTS